MPTCGPSRAEPKRGSGAPHTLSALPAGHIAAPSRRTHGHLRAARQRRTARTDADSERLPSSAPLFCWFFFLAVMHPKAPPERQHAAPDAPSSRGSAALRRTGFLRDSRDAAVIAGTAQPRRGRRAEVRGSEREGRPRSHGAPRRTPPSHSPLKQRSRSLPRATVGSPSTSWKSAILRGSGGR